MGQVSHEEHILRAFFIQQYTMGQLKMSSHKQKKQETVHHHHELHHRGDSRFRFNVRTLGTHFRFDKQKIPYVIL
jgi:hypothetical protein